MIQSVVGKILDIDLDFFLNDIAFWKSDKDRLSSEDYYPWKPEDIVRFLEVNCGLNKMAKIKGRVVINHQEVFHFWRELIEKKCLIVPFNLIHIDAHADLGLGDSSWVYLMGELLHKDIKERKYPRESSQGLNSGSYLAFAIACRWIKTLKYIHHPKGGNDLMPYHFKDFNSKTNILELKKCDFTRVNTCSIHPTDESFCVISKEPQVPFEMLDMESYHDDGNHDYITLCKSPGFTPIESDNLVPLFEEYMDVI